MLKILFVCIHNSARSQIAEELLRLKLGEKAHVESAGLEPGEINPIVADVLNTKGIDISGKQTQSVFELLKQGKVFNYVITVCDEAASERCPIFPGALKRLHWSFPDPALFDGSYVDKFEKIRILMQNIEAKIDEFASELVKIHIL